MKSWIRLNDNLIVNLDLAEAITLEQTNGKWQICFRMTSGTVYRSERFDTRAKAIGYLNRQLAAMDKQFNEWPD